MYNINKEEEVQQENDTCSPHSNYSTSMRYTDFKRQKTSRYNNDNSNSSNNNGNDSNKNEGDISMRLSQNITFTPSPSTTKSSDYHGSPIRYINNNLKMHYQ